MGRGACSKPEAASAMKCTFIRFTASGRTRLFGWHARPVSQTGG